MVRNTLRTFRPLAVAFCLLVGSYAPPVEARRVALVIGNAEYKVGPLANPLNDAAAVAEVFEKQLKFEKVILRTNLGFIDFRAALAELARETSGADLGVVYFAGHGTEVGGRNFLIPVDATLGRASALDLEAVPLDTVLGQLDGVRKLKLVILDACRNNLFALPGAKRSVSRGLARIEPEDNTLVVYAAKDGTAADDGIGGKHSPFTAALLKHIGSLGLEVRFLFGHVADDVAVATNRLQQPYLYGNLGGKQFYLQSQGTVPPVSTAAVAPPAATAAEAAEAWAAVKDSTSIAQLEVIATRFKGTVYADLAQARIAELQKAEHAKAAPSIPPPAPRAAVFGTPRVVFQAGIWRMLRTDGDGGFMYLWTDNGDKAVAVWLKSGGWSNGWWHLRNGGRENTVGFNGKLEGWADRFQDRPWDWPGLEVLPVTVAEYVMPGASGLPNVSVTKDQIRVRITKDTEIRINTRSRVITFKDVGGVFTF